ncbi:MAG: serine hydrolase domain-containing protein [Dokdonella sp.]|uniref:serine hydrolase domain-containing protein n=1 Tax=Dokdonella sp. TaxID=2291710 RepID=UPI0032678211
MSSTQRIVIAMAIFGSIFFSAGSLAAGKAKTSKPSHTTSGKSVASKSAAAAAKHKVAGIRVKPAVAGKRGKKPIVRARNVAITPPVVVPIADERAVSRDAPAIAREFNRWLDEVAASSDVSGLAAAIVKDDKVLLERGVGFADWTSREPVTGETVFRLASLSKAFATALTGVLVQDGLMHWDTKVAGMLPTFTLNDDAAAQKLTVRDILSHRVGLPHNTYDNLLEHDEPYELLVERLKDVPLACPVGDCYGYQNIAFSLIGDVTYAVTGDFYYHQVEKRIFHPLHMSTATYGRDALEGSKSWARPHHHAANGWSPFVPNENYYHVAPAAGVNASIRDMEQWLIAQMGGRPNVLSPSLLTALHTPLVETERETRASSWRRGRINDAQYALGWRIYDYAGTTLVFHAGAVQGYRAMIAFLPKYRFGAVMLWNCESPMPIGLMPMLIDRYLGLPEVNWAGIDRADTEDLPGGGD